MRAAVGDQSGGKRAARSLAAALLLALLFISAYREILSRGAPSLGPDQEEYLASGVAASETHVFFWKAPLYSLWLAAFYRIAGRDAAWYPSLEKAVSVILLALMTGALSWRLIDARTGLFAVFWVLQCKYLLVEPNNSHTLAAILTAASAICLTLKQPYGLPSALFALYLSTLVRAEMRLVLVVMAGVLICRVALECAGKKRRPSLQASAVACWGACLLLAASLSLLFFLRQGGENRYPLIDEAFAQNFAACYVERNNLQAVYPNPWKSCHEIQRAVMPGTTTMLGAFRHYPGVVASHILYNMRVSLRAIPASVLGIHHQALWLLAAALYLLSYMLKWTAASPGNGWSRLSPGQRSHLTTFALSMSMLALNTWLFRAAARYYIQLIPLLLPLLFLAIHQAMGKWLRSYDQRHPSGL
ncbi:MAG: hypothetical protein ACKVX9_02265 [Blastocatellia bacterium]